MRRKEESVAGGRSGEEPHVNGVSGFPACY